MYTYSLKELEKIDIAKNHKKRNEDNGIFYCTKDNKEYPAQLSNIKNSPAVIYYKGNIEIANRYKNIAIIGSRKCSEYGRQLSYDAGKYMAENGITVVNGLALGCDEYALRGALDSNGKCIVWLPCGLDNIQPKINRKLADEIIEKGGCLLSEYAVGTVLRKYNYIERDRLQSGISDGVIVIEAEKESGTMHTAEYAIAQYRRLACYYYGLLEYSSGNKYLEDNKEVKIIKQFSDFKEFVNDIEKEGQYQQLTLDL